MDPSDPGLGSGMAEYQMLGSDGSFGYGHSGYGSSAGSSQPQPPPSGSAPSIGSSQVPNAGSMMSMGMSGSSSAGPGYHQQLQGMPRFGPPDATKGGGMPQYPPYGTPGLPTSAQQMMSRGQYDPRGGYHPGLPEYGVSSHLGMSGGPHGPSPSQPLTSGSSAYSSRLMPSQYGSSEPQRIPHSSMPRAPAPIHPMTGHAGYPGYPSSAPGYGSSDVWGSSGQSAPHVQRPPYGYPGGSGPVGRSQGAFQPSSDQYMSSSPSIHGLQPPSSSSRPYYAPPPPVGNSSSSGPPSAATSHIPPSESSLSGSSSYGSSPFGSVRVGHSSSGQNQRQSQYSASPFGTGSSGLQPPLAPIPSSAASPAGPPGVSSRYPQQYSGYGQPFSDGGSQSRLSPFGMGGVGPNSPGYRAPYPSGSASGSSLTQMSPRRPTATPPSVSPMPPSSRTPDRISTAGTASVSSNSSYPSPSGPSSGVSSSGGPSSGPPASNSLAQLEQMVGGGTASGGSTSSSSSLPKQQQSSSSSSSYYGPPGSSNVYSHFSTPTSGHSVQSSQPNYYSSYPGGPWPIPQNTGVPQSPAPSASGASAASSSNTHGPPPNASGVYSPAGSQSLNQSNVTLRSPQQPPAGQPVNSSGMSGNLKGHSSQFSRFDNNNQFNPPVDNSSSNFHNNSQNKSSESSHLPSMSSLQKTSSGPYGDSSGAPSFPEGPVTPQSKNESESQQDQNLSKQQSEDRKIESSDNSYQDSRNQTSPGSSFFGALRGSTSTENSSSLSPDQSLVTLQKPSEQNRSQQSSGGSDSYLSRPGGYGMPPSQSDPQQASYMSQMYQQPQQNQQQPFGQQLSQFSYNSSDSYDMSGMGSMGSYHTTPSHDSSRGMSSYDQSGYPSGPHGMDNMMGGGSMSEYQGEMGSSLDPYGSGPSPYDEPFSSEPPTKRKGKGRPKKDPLVPKEPKKPRQPRTPKSPRGRGRGARNNMGDRMMPPPGPQQPPSDGFGDVYGMPPDQHPDMYSHHHPHLGPPPPGPPGLPPSAASHNQMSSLHPQDPYHASLMPPHHMTPHPLDPSQGISQQMPPHPNMSSFDGMTHVEPPPPVSMSGLIPQQMGSGVQPPPATPPSIMDQMAPSGLDQNSQESLNQETPAVPLAQLSSSQVPQLNGVGVDSLSSIKVELPPPPQQVASDASISQEPPEPSEDSVDQQIPCDDMFSQSTSNSTTETPLFAIPSSEDSSSLIPTPVQPESMSSENNSSSHAVPVPQAQGDSSQETPGGVPTEYAPITNSSETKNESDPPLPNSFEFSEDNAAQVEAETPAVKRKIGKKRKAKSEKKTTSTPEESVAPSTETTDMTPSGAEENLVGVAETETITPDVPTGSSKKAKKPKKERVKKPKKGSKDGIIPQVDASIDLDSSQIRVSEGNPDLILAGDQSTADNTADSSVAFDDATQDDNNSQQDSSMSESPTKSGKKAKGSGAPKTPKVKKPKLKDGKASSKKKLPKIALAKFKSRKKKRLGSDDENSDIEKTPPPSPDEAESGIQKRRSARVTKRTKYLDQVDIDLSGDESKMKDDKPEGAVATITVDDTMVVEKIMLMRMGTRELEPENEEEEARFAGKPPTVEVEEFYVKYKNLSYLHCDWRTEEELEKGDKRINQKIKRFKMKKDTNTSFDFLEDEPFNPDFCEVDRVLDVNIIEEVIPDPPKPVEVETTTVDPLKSSDEEKVEDNKTEEPKPETEDKKSLETEDDKMDVDKDPEDTDKPSSDDTTSQPEKKLDETCDNQKSEETSPEKPEEEVKTEKSPEDPQNESKDVEMTEDKSSEKMEPKCESSSPDESQKEVTEVKSEEKPEAVVAVPKKTRIVKHYLVKWQASSYEECTWELEDDLDPKKIENFWRFREPPPKDKTRHKKRPKPVDWRKLDESPIYKSGNTLREYQLEGLNWLTFCWYNGRNCILADEMGLGKTIQSLALINEMVKYGIHGPYLVIAPLSTIGNWQREFETWTDLNVITYHGSSASRNMITEYEMFYKNEKGQRIEGFFKFQVMITTFEVVLSDCLELQPIHWRCCVIDEAHRLKNRNCKLLEGLKLLNMEHRVLLTGTPLQNNVEELFSLLNFLEPQQFNSIEAFLSDFGELKTAEPVEKLKAILKPMMLRRLKEDVEKSLAPKEETIVEVSILFVPFQ